MSVVLFLLPIVERWERLDGMRKRRRLKQLVMEYTLDPMESTTDAISEDVPQIESDTDGSADVERQVNPYRYFGPPT